MAGHYKSLWTSEKCWGVDWVNEDGTFSTWYQFLVEMSNPAIELALLKTFNTCGKPPTPSEFLLMSKMVTTGAITLKSLILLIKGYRLLLLM